jgi:putative DNA primase/helicase
VWSWRGKNSHGGKAALPDWDSIALNQRRVYIVYDSDVMYKISVTKALARLKAFLEQRGACVEIIYLPHGQNGEKVGLDDFLARHAVQDLLALASSTLREPVWVDATTETSPSRTSRHHLTDAGNKNRLVEQFGPVIRFVSDWGWLIWDRCRWRRDPPHLGVLKLAEKTIQAMHLEADQNRDPAHSRQLALHAVASEARSRMEAMVSLARMDVQAESSAFDADPWLLNVQNGTLDLRTGTLRPHQSADLLTKLASVEYLPNVTAPTWMRFLSDIMQGNQELIDYLKRVVGYSLTGSTRERVFFVFHGTGSNGKSTFLETIGALIGDYAVRATTDTFLTKRDNTITNDLARLNGARLVVGSEIDYGRRLAEALIKQITGGDKIAARFLYQEDVEFTPVAKVILAANHKPSIQGTEPAIWNRVRLIPFNQVFSTPDQHMLDRLRAELPGILNWAIEGCLSWQTTGLGMPTEIRTATQDYRNEEDALASFIDDHCVVSPNARAMSSQLYAKYISWCDRTSEPRMSQKTFGTKLREKGFQNVKSGVKGWVGIGIRDDLDHLDHSPVSSPYESGTTDNPPEQSTIIPMVQDEVLI